MKKKSPVLLLILLISLLITACTSDDQEIKVSEEDMEIISKLSFEDVEENLTFAVEEFVDNYPYLEILDLEFEQDKLAVDSTNEVKKFNNIEMHLKLEVDSDSAQIDTDSDHLMEENFSDFVDGIEDDLLDHLLSSNPYEFSRVITTGISFLDKENSLQHSSVSGNIRDSEVLRALRNEESESEKAALAKTFDLVGDDREAYQLSKFGIRDNSFIMDFHDRTLEGEEANLTKEELSERLYLLVSEDIDFEQYIDSRADRLTIIFTEGSYNFDL